MKLAVLGDSHIGGLKRGWDALRPNYPDVALTFFGARDRDMRHLAAQGRALVATTPETRNAIRFTTGGLDALRLDDFDEALVYACGSQPYFVPRRFFSNGALRRTMSDLTENLAFLTLDRLREAAPERSFWLGLTPLLAHARSDGDQAVDAYVEGLQAFETFLRPRRVRLVGQPLNTIVNGHWTEIGFSRGSKRLAIGVGDDDEAHPPHDNFHMNDAFGALWLRAFLARLLR